MDRHRGGRCGAGALQVGNALEQAERHADRGKDEQAVRALEQALDALDRTRQQDQVTPDAKVVLTHQIAAVVRMLS